MRLNRGRVLVVVTPVLSRICHLTEGRSKACCNNSYRTHSARTKSQRNHCDESGGNESQSGRRRSDDLDGVVCSRGFLCVWMGAVAGGLHDACWPTKYQKADNSSAVLFNVGGS